MRLERRYERLGKRDERCWQRYEGRGVKQKGGGRWTREKGGGMITRDERSEIKQRGWKHKRAYR